MNKSNIFLGVALLFSFTACYDLDKIPEDVLSTVAPFTSTGEMSSYLDQFYQSGNQKYTGMYFGNGLRVQDFASGGGGGIAGLDVQSDNMASSSVNTRLAGESSLGSASGLHDYTGIRNLNFLLNNLGNCADQGTPAYNQCVGEAYYFRAWYYYQLLVSYGPLTWISKPLNPNIEEMRLPRANRTVIADSILSDLDKAIARLNPQSSSASMRVHKDVARALKSEVALFEGTWEKYHKAGNDPFFDPAATDEKIRGYFTQAAAAAKEVMDRGVWRIYSTGNVAGDYRQMFQATDLSNNPEVLWFKKYDGDQVGNNVNRYLNQGGGSVGVSASLVDDYLTREGKPFVGEQAIKAKKVFGDELRPALRDPRLSQTVCMPGQVLRPDEAPYAVPPLVGSSAYNQNMTGYSLLKHVQIDYAGNLDAEFKGATPAIQFRYADILLDYAEALAELGGAAHAQEIIDALQPLRARAGMPAVDFDREYNTAAGYPFSGLDKYIQAVRRERRIEKACEGRRLSDILRWAAADKLIVGQWPKGALFVGSNLENHPAYGGKLVYDQPSGNNLFLTGRPGDALRYIVPMNPAGYQNGWGFKLERDYLLPIQASMLERTGNAWKQNPGW